MSDQVHSRLEKNGVLVIRIDRPAKRNALTPAMYDAMANILNGSNSDPAVRVILMTGTEDCFTSGNDVADFLNPQAASGDAPVFRFLKALAGAIKPFVAAVNGPAVGVGTTMLLHADFVVAGETAIFQLPFVNLALVPEAGSTFLLPKLVGHQKAAEIALLGEPFSSETGKDIGLINSVQPDDRVFTYAMERAEVLASKPSQALIQTKALLKRGGDRVLEAMDDEAKIFAKLLASPEAQEAMKAFMERRLPDFSNLKSDWQPKG